VEDYEQAAAAARDAQTLLRSFPDVAGLTSEDAAEVEEAAAARITELLPAAITLSASGRCTDCGAGIAPWFSTCRDCSVGMAGRGPGRNHHRGTQHHDGHDRQPRPARAGRATGGRAADVGGRRTGRGGAAQDGRGAGGRTGTGRPRRSR
jgi:ATP-dependent RNA helicase SUPV3L1/SUV3